MTNTDEKFIMLVHEREILYNTKLKDHHNRNMTENLWKEVGEEMNMTMNDCKHKWTNLRNSYARYLRNQNNKPSGSGGEHKKKWYLADVMSFLKDHMQHRRHQRNSEREDGEEEPMQSVVEDDGEFPDDDANTSELVDKCPAPTRVKKYVRPRKKLPSEQVVGPMIDFLKSYTKKSVQDNSLLEYMKGLLPEYEKLTSRRQRIFKQKVVTLINDLLDEQEVEGSSAPSRTYTPVSCAISEDSFTSGSLSMQTINPPHQSGPNANYAHDFIHC